MRYNSRQTSFAAGELSKKFRNRSDLQQYKNACEELYNFYPSASGTKYRGGTISLDSAPNKFFSQTSSPSNRLFFPYLDANNEERLINLIFLDVGALGTVISVNVYEISGNSVPVLTQALSTIDAYALVQQQDGNTYSSPLPYTSIDFTRFNRCQLGSSIVITHKDSVFPPIIIYPTSIANLTSLSVGILSNNIPLAHPLKSNVNFALSMPYQKANTNTDLNFYFNTTVTATTVLTPAPTRTMYVVNAAGTAVTNFFTENFAGAFFRITDTAKQYECVVQCLDGATNTNAIPVAVIVGYPAGLGGSGGKSNNWRKGHWDQISGYPRTVTWYNQRLVYGGNKEEPDMIWCSSVDRPFQFMSDRLKQDSAATPSDASLLNWFGAITDDMPFQVRIGSNQVNRINTLVSAQALFIGTENGEFYASPMDGYFGAKNIDINKASTIGCSDVTPITLDDSIIFVDKTKRKLIRYYLSNELAFVDLTLFADDLLRKTYEDVTVYTNMQDRTFKALAYIELYNRLYVTNSYGDLFCLILTGKDSAAWSRIYLGGSGSYTNFAIPSSPKLLEMSEYFSTLLMCVDRQIAGSQEITLERFGFDFEHELLTNKSREFFDKPVFSDCALVVSAELTYVNYVVTLANGTLDYIACQDALQVFVGMPVKMAVDGVGTLPTGLDISTTYYARNYGSAPFYVNVFTLHPTKAKALAGTDKVVFANDGIGSFLMTSELAAEETTNGTDTLITKWAGAATLGGETVDALIDGVVTEIFVPTTGLIEHAGFREAILGFPYEGKLKSFPIEGGVQGDSSRGSITRVDRLSISFYKTFAGSFGAGDYGLEVIPFDGIEYSGDKTVDFPTSPDREIQIVVKQEQPLPMTILGYTVRGVTNEG